MPINRGFWNQNEKDLFNRAYRQYGKDWYLISRIITTRTVQQVRSHAQKVLPKMIDERNEIQRQNCLRKIIKHPRYLRKRFPAPKYFAPPLFPNFPPVCEKYQTNTRKSSSISKKNESPKLIKTKSQQRLSLNLSVKVQLTPKSRQQKNDFWDSPSDGFQDYVQENYKMEEDYSQ